MPLLSLAASLLADAIIGGASYTKFNNANAYLAVGDSNAVFNAAHTDLQGGNKFRKAMDATFPQRSNGALTFQATYATTDANWAWNEWGIANAAAAGNMLNRKVESLGTKTNTATWQLSVTITLSV
jgi:hypothetical protein